MNEAIVALGSNLGDSEATLRQAIEDLETLGRVVAVSQLFESDPIGGPEQDPFLNAVAVVETNVEPRAFLKGLHVIEGEHGRAREVHWGPRTLDLDLIAVGDETSNREELVLPHPRAAERAFVLAPLVAIRPDFTFPDGRRAAALLEDVADQQLRVVGGDDWSVEPRAEHPLRLIVAGPGGAGASLGVAATGAGHDVVAVISRSGNDGDIGSPVIAWTDPVPEADLLLLTVPDRALTAVATTLNTRLPAGVTVAHCSGLTPLSVLGPIADAGHPVGGLHPLAALPDGRGAKVLRGAGFAIGGSDPDTVALLTSFAQSLGGIPFEITDVARPAYHAAASIAANHVTTLLGAVQELAAANGIPFGIYQPLVQTAVEASFQAGPAKALTGPVARGDEGTVRVQRLAVEEQAPELLPLLDALNEATRRLAEQD